jgi:hypothetical protein
MTLDAGEGGRFVGVAAGGGDGMAVSVGGDNSVGASVAVGEIGVGLLKLQAILNGMINRMRKRNTLGLLENIQGS